MGTGKEGGRNKEEGRKANVNARVAARVQLYFLNYLHHALIQPNPKKKAVVPASSSSAQCSLTPAGGRQAGRQAGRQTDRPALHLEQCAPCSPGHKFRHGGRRRAVSLHAACLPAARPPPPRHSSLISRREDGRGRTDGRHNKTPRRLRGYFFSNQDWMAGKLEEPRSARALVKGSE